MTDPARPNTTPAWQTPVALVLAVLALLVALGLGWQSYMQMQSLEVQLARRIGEFDAASREARAAARAANTALADLQSRLAALEARAQETQNQQIALAAMYQELANSADERVVADIEQTLLLARQQLQLAGNVRAALIGLEAADARLGQLGKAQFAPLRQAIVRDMARLKLLPAADIDGLSARLDSLIRAIDSLKPESESEPPARVAAPVRQSALGTLEAVGREAWEEIKSLLRIRRLDHPELPLLTPAQNYFLRENLKLRLLAARLGILQRDEAAFRADLGAAHKWVAHYFNRRDPATQTFLTSLDELLRAPVALQDAQINASLQAVQAARRGRQ